MTNRGSPDRIPKQPAAAPLAKGGIEQRGAPGASLLAEVSDGNEIAQTRDVLGASGGAIPNQVERPGAG